MSQNQLKKLVVNIIKSKAQIRQLIIQRESSIDSYILRNNARIYTLKKLEQDIEKIEKGSLDETHIKDNINNLISIIKHQCQELKYVLRTIKIKDQKQALTLIQKAKVLEKMIDSNIKSLLGYQAFIEKYNIELPALFSRRKLKKEISRESKLLDGYIKQYRKHKKKKNKKSFTLPFLYLLKSILCASVLGMSGLLGSVCPGVGTVVGISIGITLSIGILGLIKGIFYTLRASMPSLSRHNAITKREKARNSILRHRNVEYSIIFFMASGMAAGFLCGMMLSFVFPVMIMAISAGVGGIVGIVGVLFIAVPLHQLFLNNIEQYEEQCERDLKESSGYVDLEEKQEFKILLDEYKASTFLEQGHVDSPQLRYKKELFRFFQQSEPCPVIFKTSSNPMKRYSRPD